MAEEVDTISQEKAKEALGVRVEGPQEPGVSSVPMYTMGVPGVVMVQPTLPPNLWPHDFLALSICVAVFTGFFNSLFSLPLSILAIVLGLLCRSASKRSDYASAKNYSKTSLGLLTSATVVFSSMWFVGCVMGLAYTFPWLIFETG